MNTLALCAIIAVTNGVFQHPAPRVLFDRGNSRYQEGQYQQALDAYLSIVSQGYQSAALSYNIGNTYFKLGDLGRSILYYERALRQNPRDDDARANLELARSLTADEIRPLPGFLPFRVIGWWVGLLPQTSLLVIVATSYFAAAAALVAKLLLRDDTRRRWAGRVLVASAVVFVLFGITLSAVQFGWGTATEGVILADEVSVQSAPSDDRSLEVFRIHEGTKFRIDQQTGEWAEIVLADGKVGWVRVEFFEII